MTIGGSIFLIAVGAILRYAMNVRVSGVDLDVVGLILMIAGIVGLILGFAMMVMSRDRGTTVERRETRNPRDPRV